MFQLLKEPCAPGVLFLSLQSRKHGDGLPRIYWGSLSEADLRLSSFKVQDFRDAWVT